MITVEHEASKTFHEISAKFVIGSDGVNSAVRAAMFRQGRFDFNQQYIPHGKKKKKSDYSQKAIFEDVGVRVCRWRKGCRVALCVFVLSLLDMNGIKKLNVFENSVQGTHDYS